MGANLPPPFFLYYRGFVAEQGLKQHQQGAVGFSASCTLFRNRLKGDLRHRHQLVLHVTSSPTVLPSPTASAVFTAPTMLSADEAPT